MVSSFYHIIVCCVSIFIHINYIYAFYELPLKDDRIMNLSSSKMIYNHTSYKDGEFKVAFRCYNNALAEDNNDKINSTTQFNMQFSYGFSTCLSISPLVNLNESELIECYIKVNCKDTFQETAFDQTAYKISPDGNLSNDKCNIDVNQDAESDNRHTFAIKNLRDGFYFLSIQLKPVENNGTVPNNQSVTNATNIIEMSVDLESNNGHLTMVDYSVYKFHVCLCCFYFIIVLTSAVYFVYLRRNTNKLHSILGISLLTGLLASFFYISAYESLNRTVSTVHEMKNVMVIAAILSSIRRITIDVTILLMAVGYTILPMQNLSIRRPLVIFSCYAIIYVSLAIFNHVSAKSHRLIHYSIFLVNNMLTMIIYVFSFVYLRNTANHSYQRRSPQMEYIGIFYRRFGYVLALLIAILLALILPQFFDLLKYNTCSHVYKFVFFETYWILHSLICTIAIFLLIVFHPNAQAEIYGSFNFNYSQLPKDEKQMVSMFPISSANIQIQRSNTEIRDAFTLFDDTEDDQNNTPNNNIVRFHKLQ